MEPIIVPLGFFAMFAFVIHVIVSGIVRSRLMARQSQVLMHIIDKAASESASAAFLESPFGRSLLDGADRRTVILTHAIGAAQTFLVMTVVGITLLVVRGRATGDEERTALLALGLLGVVVGAAFLIGALVTWVLARRWGLIDGAKPTPVQGSTDPRTSSREPVLRYPRAEPARKQHAYAAVRAACGRPCSSCHRHPPLGLFPGPGEERPDGESGDVRSPVEHRAREHDAFAEPMPDRPARTIERGGVVALHLDRESLARRRAGSLPRGITKSISRSPDERQYPTAPGTALAWINV